MSEWFLLTVHQNMDAFYRTYVYQRVKLNYIVADRHQISKYCTPKYNNMTPSIKHV